MDYFSILPVQLSLELVSHVVLITLGGVLVMHTFGIGPVCYDGVAKVSHPILGGGLLYGSAIVLSFFVDHGNHETYMVFFALFLLCIFGSYLMMFFAMRRKLGSNSLTAHYFVALLSGVVYAGFAVREFTNAGGSMFLAYVSSELVGTILLFLFAHAYLAESIKVNK